jgi:hypothetical protein
MQAVMYALDITLLTVLYAIVGGGWWMGATVYLVVANAAFTTLPKGLGRAVSGYAALAFVAMLMTHSLGIGEYQTFLGIQTIEGHFAFAAVAAMFGTMVMLTGIFLQDSFVTRASRQKDFARVKSSFAMRRRWKPSADLPAASLTISTTSSPLFARTTIFCSRIFPKVIPLDAKQQVLQRLSTMRRISRASSSRSAVAR